MSIIPDPPASPLLKKEKPPSLRVGQLLLIDTKVLPARRASLRQLCEFYQSLLGLNYTGEVLTPDQHPAWRFTFEQRAILLQPPNPLTGGSPEPAEEPVRELELTVLHFPTALQILTARGIPYILERSTTFTRCAFIRDPAANWLALHESRPL